MIYKGYKLRIRCIDWEQVKVIDNFWGSIDDVVTKDKVIGLGMNWSDDYLYFDYALGTIDDEEVLEKLKNCVPNLQNLKVQFIGWRLP